MRNSSNVRVILLDTLTGLRNMSIDVKTANAITKTASAINQSFRFDIENKRENIKLMKATASKNWKDIKSKSLTI